MTRTPVWNFKVNVITFEQVNRFIILVFLFLQGAESWITFAPYEEGIICRGQGRQVCFKQEISLQIMDSLGSVLFSRTLIALD